jgi:ubiquinone/menaquinone biosynthesis C-methylase UbiE
VSDDPISQEAAETFDRFAETYVRVSETNAWNAGYERPLFRAMIGDVRGLRMLDAGGGGGANAEWFAESGAELTTIDISPEMARLARERLDGRGRVVVADMSGPLGFPDESFDLVASSLALAYVSDWSVPMGEFFRVLVPGGRLVFTTHNPVLDQQLFPTDAYRAIEPVEDRWESFGADPVTMRFYRRSISATLMPVLEAGFVIERVDEPPPPEDLAANHPDSYERLRSEPSFLFIAARKPE